MVKQIISGTILDCLAQICNPQHFCLSLSSNSKQACSKLSSQAVSRKTNERNLKNGKKPDFVSNLRPRTLFREFYLYYQLKLVPRYHSMQFKGVLMSHTCENGEKPNFGPNFCPFGSYLSPPSSFVSFTSTISQKLFQAIIL